MALHWHYDRHVQIILNTTDCDKSFKCSLVFQITGLINLGAGYGSERHSLMSIWHTNRKASVLLFCTVSIELCIPNVLEKWYVSSFKELLHSLVWLKEHAAQKWLQGFVLLLLNSDLYLCTSGDFLQICLRLSRAESSSWSEPLTLSVLLSTGWGWSSFPRAAAGSLLHMYSWAQSFKSVSVWLLPESSLV